jgi:hypothetical protein
VVADSKKLSLGQRDYHIEENALDVVPAQTSSRLRSSSGPRTGRSFVLRNHRRLQAGGRVRDLLLLQPLVEDSERLVRASAVLGARRSGSRRGAPPLPIKR